MVSLLIVSHSAKIAEGVQEFVGQAAGPSVKIAAAGGTADGGLGTSVDLIIKRLQEVASPDGTLVLVDLGASVMSVETAIEGIGATNVRISDAPLVEGAYFAALEAAAESTLEEIAAAALQARQLEKVQS